MAFMIIDNDSCNIFDILDSRKSNDLEKFFKRYSKKQRDKAKLISTDFFMNIFISLKVFLELTIFVLLLKYMLP